MVISAEMILLAGAHGLGAIGIDTTEAPGTLIHRSHISSTVTDGVSLYANNAAPVEVLVSVVWGGDTRYARVPAGAREYVVIECGHISGTDTAPLEIRAFADRADVVSIYGDATRDGVAVVLH